MKFVIVFCTHTVKESGTFIDMSADIVYLEFSCKDFLKYTQQNHVYFLVQTCVL
jgi:hypothetical protein